jgi:hypothetical protein
MLSILIAVATPVLPYCDKPGELALQTSLAADLHVTYAVTGTPLRVCVDQAMYPYAAGRGHRFYACYSVGLGSATDRFCGGGNSYADWHGYRITVRLRTPRFTAPCDVWLEVEPTPRKTP